jgi:hypothetical protein
MLGGRDERVVAMMDTVAGDGAVDFLLQQEVSGVHVMYVAGRQNMQHEVCVLCYVYGAPRSRCGSLQLVSNKHCWN